MNPNIAIAPSNIWPRTTNGVHKEYSTYLLDNLLVLTFDKCNEKNYRFSWLNVCIYLNIYNTKSFIQNCSENVVVKNAAPGVIWL